MQSGTEDLNLHDDVRWKGGYIIDNLVQETQFSYLAFSAEGG